MDVGHLRHILSQASSETALAGLGGTSKGCAAGGTRDDPESSQGGKGKGSCTLSINHTAHGKKRKKAQCPPALSSSPLCPPVAAFP